MKMAQWLDHDQGLTVAIKIHKRRDDNQRLNIKKECEVLKNANHPNIVKIYAHSDDATIFYREQEYGWETYSYVYDVVVLELAPGYDLLQHVA